LRTIDGMITLSTLLSELPQEDPGVAGNRGRGHAHRVVPAFVVGTVLSTRAGPNDVVRARHGDTSGIRERVEPLVARHRVVITG
jgi:hypothetical protein